MTRILFMKYLHDDVLRMIAEFFAEQVHPSHILCIRFYAYLKGHITVFVQSQGGYGMLGDLPLINIASVPGDPELS